MIIVALEIWSLLWKCFLFSALSTVPSGRENDAWKPLFPLLFKCSRMLLCAADWGLWGNGLDLCLKSKWAGPLSVDLIFGSGGWPFFGHFSSWAVYRGSLVLLGFGSWWTPEVWDLIHSGPRKNGPLHHSWRWSSIWESTWNVHIPVYEHGSSFQQNVQQGHGWSLHNNHEENSWGIPRIRGANIIGWCWRRNWEMLEYDHSQVPFH